MESINIEQTRSSGDGMDNTLLTSSENSLKILHVKLNYRPSPELLRSLQPVQPKTIIPSIPKYVPNERKKPKCLIKKPKEPKFVPYEPYKGAVEPIIRHKKIVQKASKNNVDIHDLVTQISEVRVAELNKAKLDSMCSSETLIPRKQWENEKRCYETDIKNLRETNAHLENQLKFQAQVNSELKTLLVAAVGEDLESRVQHLTEDKLQLARALLNSANHLTSHQEHTEWLSGQCEVWRSKFLASSLMVEELARWKSALTKRVTELRENLKIIMYDGKKAREDLFKTHKCLTEIVRHCNGEATTLKFANIIELSRSNSVMSEELARNLIKDYDSTITVDMANLSQNTPAENSALQILKNPVTILGKPDILCNALVGAAMSISGGQMFLQHPSHHATCCAHCKGELEDI